MIKRCVIAFDISGNPYKYRKVTSLYKLHIWLLQHNVKPKAYNVYDRHTKQFIKQYKANEFLHFYFD